MDAEARIEERVEALRALLGEDARVLPQHADLKRGARGYDLLAIGELTHVFHDGCTLGLAGRDPCALYVTLLVRGDTPTRDEEDLSLDRDAVVASPIVQEWERRGYQVDEFRGWMEGLRCFGVDVVKETGSLESLAAEIRQITGLETWGEV